MSTLKDKSGHPPQKMTCTDSTYKTDLPACADEEKGCVAFLRSLDGRRKWIILYMGWMEIVNYGSTALIGPFFPEEAKRAGMSVSVTGYVISCFSYAVALGSPFWGKLIPKLGPKNTVLIGGSFLGIANIAFGIALVYIGDLSMFTAVCFFLRLCLGFSMSALATGYFAMISDNFYESIGTAMGIHEIFLGIGLSTGPIIGGVVNMLGGVCAAYGFYGCCILLSTMGAYFAFPDMPTTGINKCRSPGSMTQLLFKPTTVVLSLTILSSGIFWMSLSPTLEPHLRTLNVTEGQMVLIFTLKSAAYSLSCPLVGYISDKYGNGWCIMVFGMCLFAVSFILLGPSSMILPFLENSLWLTIISLILTGFSLASAVIPTVQAMMDAAVHDCGMPRGMTTYGIVAGLWLLIISVGEGTGPTAGGLLTQQYSFPGATTILAICEIPLAIVVGVFFFWKTRHAKPLVTDE